MRATKSTHWIAALLLWAPLMASAATDPECLKHLGGALSGAECFIGLSNDLKANNKEVVEKIIATIPKGNKNRTVLQNYMRAQASANQYCELARQSATVWIDEKRGPKAMYNQPDVIYLQCIYDNLEHQNKFLKDVLKNALEQ